MTHPEAATGSSSPHHVLVSAQNLVERFMIRLEAEAVTTELRMRNRSCYLAFHILVDFVLQEHVQHPVAGAFDQTAGDIGEFPQ